MSTGWAPWCRAAIGRYQPDAIAHRLLEKALNRAPGASVIESEFIPGG